ncbi:MAG TPA: hypothetical protein VGK73_15060 [Polyangiaceae bacterium]
MVTYRAAVHTNRVGTQNMMAPGFVLEFKRDSKKARAEVMARFAELLANNLPDTGARAYLQMTDRIGTTWLCECTGTPTRRTRYSCAVASGVWTDAKGQIIDIQAGIPANDPRLDSYCDSH